MSLKTFLKGELSAVVVEAGLVVSAAAGEVRQVASDMRSELAVELAALRAEASSVAADVVTESKETRDSIIKAARLGTVTRHDSRGTYVLVDGVEKSMTVLPVEGAEIKRGTRVFVIRNLSGEDVACPTVGKREKIVALLVGAYNKHAGV